MGHREKIRITYRYVVRHAETAYNVLNTVVNYGLVKVGR
jgi:hypothetical protein